ncbi:Zn(II)2Cys6 transcription factor [Aspergillus vadensis CBS 113365]|uniref:Zn(II)2Cys6 transcription factor n=1 Tax=Aspergillus vadensis (strain CBS 113365 / IMI 142717 / IBT 24658) TaxID=1448311 RepID=A0A319BCU3_ASPVC|nr:Zn(II)2Cys6 transcription factor [Aspergillus vadensis CBS 113365]PYH70926.1 Zn(II)2Cys6 transcription factor [Aspergillus vadensis CBS 113365]
MPSTSRPVKVACLACRASKIRCDGQYPCANCTIHRQECQYQPSRRGGARRGPIAAEERAMKKAQRLQTATGVYNHAMTNDDFTPAQILQINAATPDSLPSPSPNETGSRLSNTLQRKDSPGFPLSPRGPRTGQELRETVRHPTRSLRAYRCDQDLINAYYIFIHPYLPLLPPPAVSQYVDKPVALSMRSAIVDASHLPYWPTTSLGLAVAAILALIPLPGDAHAMENEAVSLRRSYADYFARSALDVSEESLQPSSNFDLTQGPCSPLHPEIPQQMEPVLALALLSLYECCQRGNVSKMRIRANQALTMAMDLSLHTQKSANNCSDAIRRCWWSTMFLVYQSSILTASVSFATFRSRRRDLANSAMYAPLITSDDFRITTPYIVIRGCREPWPYIVQAQSLLHRSCTITHQLSNETTHDQGCLPCSFHDEIQHLDSSLLDIAIETDRYRCIANCQGTEADAERVLWAMSRILIHTARLLLYRVRAFPDRPADSFTTTTNSNTSRNRTPLSPSRRAEIDAIFQFDEQESTRVCIRSALLISRVFRHLPTPNPMYSDTPADGETFGFGLGLGQISGDSGRSLTSPRSLPYMAWCGMQSFYVLAMVLWRVRAALSAGNLNSIYNLLDRPTERTAIQDAERLEEELHMGIESLRVSMKADGVYEGVGRMFRELEKMYDATMMG